MANGFVYFQSTDPGAPVLSGAQGALINVLDWIINLPPDPYKWTKEFEGTNQAVYRAPEGDRMFLQILDNLSTTNTNSNPSSRVATARMFETMEDVSTGFSPVPTDTQAGWSGLFNAMAWAKSDVTSSAARAYEGIVTSRWIWLVTYYEGAQPTLGYFHFFGDLCGWNGGSDDYLTLIIGQRGGALGATALGSNQGFFDNTVATGLALFPTNNGQNSSNTTTVSRSFVRRRADGDVAGSVCAPKTWGLNLRAKSTVVLGRTLSMPIPVVDHMTTATVMGADAYPRGWLPNIRVMSTRAATGDTFTDGDRQFKVIRPAGSTTTVLISLALEISNTDPNYQGF
jgi:hypothetical protein